MQQKSCQQQRWGPNAELPHRHGSIFQFNTELLNAAAHTKYRDLPLSTSVGQHSCLYISDPCQAPSSSNSRAGQVSSTPYQNEASHSEHQPHCPIQTPPLTLTLHPVSECVCICHPSDTARLPIQVLLSA